MKGTEWQKSFLVCTYVRIWVCKYWHMQLPKSFKGTASSEDTFLQPTGNSRLKKCVISIQSYVYNEMIRLFPMKLPVKNYSDVDWFRQAKNTELTRCCIICCLWLWQTFLILCMNCRCKRKTHWISKCTTVCVCVCVCGHIHWHGLPRQHSSNSQ